MASENENRVELKERELRLLFEEYKKDPSLFDRESLVEDAKTLADFGIYIKGKEDFPSGVIKFLPQDFIVEEVLEDGEVLNVKKENLLLPSTSLPEGPTFYATLVKCSLSTLHAVEELAKELKCSTEQIRYAGLKDKDALSSQRISIRQVSLDQLKQVKSTHFFLKDVVSGKGALEKGKLKGNMFTILLRTEPAFFEQKNFEVFLSRVAEVRENGFYNYFYLQRFGTPRLIAHHLGMDIIHGYHRKTIESFITYRSKYEIPYFRNLRKELAGIFGNWTEMIKILESFPLIFSNELKMVRYLEKHPEDFSGALVQVQDQVGMWVAAVSSWLYNQLLASYLRAGKETPEVLPLFLDSINSGRIYDKLMQDLRITVGNLRNLRAFPSIQAPKRPIVTKQRIDIEKVEVVDEGIVLKFFLPKGEYATTFLSHIFNLISDRPSIDISKKALDLKSVIGDGDMGDVLELFTPVIHSKSKNYFEELAKDEMKK